MKKQNIKPKELRTAEGAFGSGSSTPTKDEGGEQFYGKTIGGKEQADYEKLRNTALNKHLDRKRAGWTHFRESDGKGGLTDWKPFDTTPPSPNPNPEGWAEELKELESIIDAFLSHASSSGTSINTYEMAYNIIQWFHKQKL